MASRSLTETWGTLLKETGDELEAKAKAALEVVQSPGAPTYMRDEAVRSAIYGYTQYNVPVTLKDGMDAVVMLSKESSLLGRADMLEPSRFLAIRNTWHTCLKTAGVLDCVQALDAVIPYRLDKDSFVKVGDRSDDIANRCMK